MTKELSAAQCVLNALSYADDVGRRNRADERVMGVVSDAIRGVYALHPEIVEPNQTNQKGKD